MIPRLAVALALVSLPALAEPVTAPDCTADVTVAAGPVLDVVYRCRATQPVVFAAEDDAIAAHVKNARDGAGQPLAGARGEWRVAPVNGLAEMRYRYDVADYARGVDSTSSAVRRGESVLVNLSGWLLSPGGEGRAPVIDIRVAAAPGLALATGLPTVGGAARLAGSRVEYAGYTAIGRLDLREIAVPGAAPLRLAILDGISDSGRAALADWVRRTAEAEAAYWKGFPAEHLLVGLVPMDERRAVGFGRTQSGGGATIMVEVNRNVDARKLFDDWVLVHEMIHSGMPSLRGRATWFMEGAATYIEPIIRARAGWKTEEVVWKEWVDNMPQGAGAFARGLADASGRENYWAGALFMLMADLGIRRATDGAKGLEDCLVGALRGGYDAPRTVRLPEYVAACDRATGATVVSGLVERYDRKGEAVDLASFWRALGVAETGGRIVLDDGAPQARWRKMIVMGK